VVEIAREKPIGLGPKKSKFDLHYFNEEERS
jgi:hypothetical protein